MKIRLWNRKTDYDMVVAWWKGHHCPDDYIVPTERLPPSGWIVENDEGVPVCITWLYYMAHVPCAMLGSVVSNPKIGHKQRLEALDLLFLRIATEADKNNVHTIMGITTREGIARRAARTGFRKTTTHSVEFQREKGCFHG